MKTRYIVLLIIGVTYFQNTQGMEHLHLQPNSKTLKNCGNLSLVPKKTSLQIIAACSPDTKNNLRATNKKLKNLFTFNKLHKLLKFRFNFGTTQEMYKLCQMIVITNDTKNKNALLAYLNVHTIELKPLSIVITNVSNDTTLNKNYYTKSESSENENSYLINGDKTPNNNLYNATQTVIELNSITQHQTTQHTLRFKSYLYDTCSMVFFSLVMPVAFVAGVATTVVGISTCGFHGCHNITNI